MKLTFSATLLIFCLFVSSQVLALSESTASNGGDVGHLYKSLVTSGVEGDCGMGACDVTAKSVICEIKGLRKGVRSYSCGLIDGLNTQRISIKGSRAKKLYVAIRKNGIRGNCSGNFCRVGALDIGCTMNKHPHRRSYSCKIDRTEG